MISMIDSKKNIYLNDRINIWLPCFTVLCHHQPIIWTVANLLKWTFLLSGTEAGLSVVRSWPIFLCFFRLDLSWAASGRSESEVLHSFCSPFLDILALTAPLRSRNIRERPEISGVLTPAVCCLRAGLLLCALLRCSRSTRLRSRLRLRARWWSGGGAWWGWGPWCRHTDWDRSSWVISGGYLQHNNDRNTQIFLVLKYFKYWNILSTEIF